MDIPREPTKKRGRYFIGAAVVLAVVVLTAALSRLEPAAPSVDRATLWIDTVRRGTMVREVRGPGTLVPEQIRYISAVTGGRIEQLPVRPGVTVTPETLLLVLSNPDVQLQALAAEQQLSEAEAALVTLRTTLESERLTQEGVVATTRAEYEKAKRDAEVANALGKKKLLSANEVGTANDKAEELATRMEIERKRLAVLSTSVDEQIALQKEQVKRLRAIAKFRQDQIESMQVRAGTAGQLTELPLELGQWVNPGAMLAKIAQPGRLKAVLKVPETQAKDVTIGQPTSIDTRNGIVKGHVMRIDPAVENGTVTVEVALDGKLPKGARPDLSVDGTIEIERLEDVLYVGRPAYGQAESTVGLFKLTPDRKEATRVSVKLGRSSVNTIEIVQGLNVGDKVIISDMSAWDAQSRVRLK